MLATSRPSARRWISRSGDGRVAFVAKQDCARAATEVLAGQEGAGAVYEITGPELLSYRDAAAIASEMSGRPIAYAEPSPDDDREARAQAETWIGPFTMDDLISTEQAIRDGYDAVCTQHVEMITGRKPLTLREVYAAAGIGSPSGGQPIR